jgi:peptidylprolyl isomerase
MKKNMIVWILIVLVVVVVLVFLTINLNHQNKMPENNNAQVGSVTPTGVGAQAGDLVTVNYTGRLADGTVFDSNVDPKFSHVQPFQFTLGAGQVIPGWDKGIVGMKVGEKKTLVIPPEDAYGAAGAGGVIPPNATLTFDVEVTNITSGTAK